MKPQVRTITAIVLTGIWVNASEFFRNEVLLKKFWTDHYRSLGLVFPSEPLNGILWLVWGFLFAASIYFLTRKFNFMETALIGWLMAFVMMWVVTWNMEVLPLAILVYAVPLSILEVCIGSYICLRISPVGQ